MSQLSCLTCGIPKRSQVCSVLGREPDFASTSCVSVSIPAPVSAFFNLYVMHSHQHSLHVVILLYLPKEDNV